MSETLLPVGVHPMTVDEVYDLFVARAPFRPQREALWRVFTVYTRIAHETVPGTTLLMDGDFTVYRDTVAPRDIQFVAMVDFNQWAGLSETVRDQLQAMRDDARVLDVRYVPDWDLRSRDLWIEYFSHHRDALGQRVPGVFRGVVEVVL